MKTGIVLYEYFGSALNGHLGDSVAAAGDANGDGFADFLISEPKLNTFSMYSGFDGSVIQSFSSLPSDFYTGFPRSLADAGDLDGDTLRDVAVGQIGGTIGLVGAVEVYSTGTGLRILQAFGDDPSEQLGKSVAGGVDMNGDGFLDFLGGAQGDLDLAGNLVGSVSVFSGFDGTVIAKQFGAVNPPLLLGKHVAFVGDANGDGAQDYGSVALTGGIPGSSGYVRLYSGADHAQIAEFTTPAGFDKFGAGFAVLDDANGDLLPDFVIGAPSDRLAYVMTAAGSRIYGEGEPQQTLELDWASAGGVTPADGSAVLSGGAPGALGLLAVATAPTALPFFGTTLLVDPIAPGFLTFPFTFDGGGAFSVGATLLSTPLDGTVLYLQAVEVAAVAPAVSLNSSNGLELLFTD